MGKMPAGIPAFVCVNIMERLRNYVASDESCTLGGWVHVRPTEGYISGEIVSKYCLLICRRGSSHGNNSHNDDTRARARRHKRDASTDRFSISTIVIQISALTVVSSVTTLSVV